MMGPGLLTIVSAPGPIAIGAMPLAGASVLSSSYHPIFFFSPLITGIACQRNARQLDSSKELGL